MSPRTRKHIDHEGPVSTPSWYGDTEDATDVPDEFPRQHYDIDLVGAERRGLDGCDLIVEPSPSLDPIETRHPVLLAPLPDGPPDGPPPTLDDVRADLRLAESDPILGFAGDVERMRFNVRRLLQAAVIASWCLVLAWFASWGYARFHLLAPDIDRWLVVLAALVFAGLSILYLSVVEEPVTRRSGSGRDFDELDWSRRGIYKLRILDLGWAALGVAPLAAFFLSFS